jgi:hypothetical protein
MFRKRWFWPLLALSVYGVYGLLTIAVDAIAQAQVP